MNIYKTNHIIPNIYLKKYQLTKIDDYSYGIKKDYIIDSNSICNKLTHRGKMVIICNYESNTMILIDPKDNSYHIIMF